MNRPSFSLIIFFNFEISKTIKKSKNLLQIKQMQKCVGTNVSINLQCCWSNILMPSHVSKVPMTLKTTAYLVKTFSPLSTTCRYMSLFSSPASVLKSVWHESDVFTLFWANCSVIKVKNVFDRMTEESRLVHLLGENLLMRFAVA